MTVLVTYAATVILSLVLVAAVALIIVFLVKKKRGTTQGGAYCQSCPNARFCHRKNPTGCGRYRK